MASAQTPHGEWLFYVQDRMPLSSSTAKRAIQLYAFSQSQPELFATLRPLGLTKIYALLSSLQPNPTIRMPSDC